MQLNFDKLNKISGNASPESEEARTDQAGGKCDELQARADANKREKKTIEMVENRYRLNFAKAVSYRSDIVKGIKCGERLDILLLQACNALAAITNDDILVHIVIDNLQANYGIPAQDINRVNEVIRELEEKQKIAAAAYRKQTSEAERSEAKKALDIIAKEIEKYQRQKELVADIEKRY